jgi:hypothetical protein
MILLDVFYVALATLAVMGLLHLLTFAVIRIMYPPAPKIIYRDMPVPQNVGPVAVASHVPVSLPPSFAPPAPAPPAFIQPEQEVQLPSYEPRPTPTPTTSRLDAGLPDGLQETRPPGT